MNTKNIHTKKRKKIRQERRLRGRKWKPKAAAVKLAFANCERQILLNHKSNLVNKEEKNSDRLLIKEVRAVRGKKIHTHTQR